MGSADSKSVRRPAVVSLGNQAAEEAVCDREDVLVAISSGLTHCVTPQHIVFDLTARLLLAPHELAVGFEAQKEFNRERPLLAGLQTRVASR
jgi:hypothetical protein